MADKEITVKLKKSLIGSKDYQKQSVRGLGLSKLGQVVSVQDTPENRGILQDEIDNWKGTSYNWDNNDT